MNFENDVTLVAGVDAKYVNQLECTFPLWLKFWPKLREIPWLFFFDGRTPSLRDRIELLIRPFRHYSSTQVQAWLPPECDQYEDQRDRMLTAWSLLPPALVQSPYWLKIDADAYPVRPIAGSFPVMRWFEAEPAIVGHAWGYTKTRGSRVEWFDIFDDWADQTELMQHRPRLNIKFGQSRRIPHKRIASFVSFFHTGFTAAVAGQAMANDERLTIPVPSQDTFFWACAERMKLPVVRVRMKRHGFTNEPNFSKLQVKVKELL